MISKSIAVLPFVNMSNDADNEYFSDGVSEEIINALTSIDGLNVTARTSSFAFKNVNQDIRKIGEKLGVSTVLEGSVRKSNNQLRIGAQLSRTSDGFNIWAQNFDRELVDVFDIQDEISLLIADQIRENFGHFEIDDRLINLSNISPSMYETYLKGKYLLNTFVKEEIEKGIELLKEVVAESPNFAHGYSTIHYGYNMLVAAGFSEASILIDAQYYLDRALDLDAYLPECYHSLGWNALNKDWDFIQAEKHLKHAIALRPGYADAHQKLFITLALSGRIEESFRHIQQALTLDPLSALNKYFLGYYHYLKCDFDSALPHFEDSIELSPSFIYPHLLKTLSLIAKKENDWEKHLNHLEQTELKPIDKKLIQMLIQSSMSSLNTKSQDFKDLLGELDGDEKGRFRLFLIHVYTINGDFDQALDLMIKAVELKEPLMTLLREDPLLKPLHQKDEFIKGLDKIYKLVPETSVLKKSSEDSKIQKYSSAEIANLKSQMERLLVEEQLYLDATLTLRALATRMDIHPNNLSWLINEETGTNFNECINSYRLANFQEKALLPENKHLTLLGLAYDSGFNSKTVFNTYFKKKMGCSPSQWLADQS